MAMLSKQLSDAYWPPERGPNPPADRARGDAAVDVLTLGELHAFFTECTTGPTYCMVKRRVQEVLKTFPPYLEEKKDRALAAAASAKSAYKALMVAVAEMQEAD